MVILCHKTSNSLLHVTLTEGRFLTCIVSDLMVYGIICYYRHTEEMIKKLRSAGLGFYVRETDTQQKLGLKLQQTFVQCNMFASLPQERSHCGS